MKTFLRVQQIRYLIVAQLCAEHTLMATLDIHTRQVIESPWLEENQFYPMFYLISIYIVCTSGRMRQMLNIIA